MYGPYQDVFNDEKLENFVKCTDVSKILFWLLDMFLIISI